jgi:hypothetical protein
MWAPIAFGIGGPQNVVAFAVDVAQPSGKTEMSTVPGMSDRESENPDRGRSGRLGTLLPRGVVGEVLAKDKDAWAAEFWSCGDVCVYGEGIMQAGQGVNDGCWTGVVRGALAL